MKLLTHIPSWLKNKFLLAGVSFLVWMIFFDPKDIQFGLSQMSYYNELRKSEHHLSGLIVDTKEEFNQLKTNAETIEKYARENYLMKKDNEDLFIVSDSVTAK